MYPLPNCICVLEFQWGCREHRRTDGGGGQGWSWMLQVGAGTEGDLQGLQKPIDAWREERT